MPRRQGAPGEPADHFVRRRFPDGTPKRDAAVGAVEMAVVAASLQTWLDDTGTSITALASDTGLARTTIYDLLAGRVFIDVVTLARLERTVGVQLWPGPGQ